MSVKIQCLTPVACYLSIQNQPELLNLLVTWLLGSDVPKSKIIIHSTLFLKRNLEVVFAVK